MSPEAQRIAIAEACGWKHIAFKRGWIKAGDGETQCVIPDYLNNLNAMNDAEKALSVREKQNYISTLRNICVVAGCWPETATADQRAQAFLHTIGKWEDAK